MEKVNQKKDLIKAVIFDMDGVLIDSMSFWRGALKEVVEENGSEYKESLWQRLKGGRVDEVIKSWHQAEPLKNISLEEAEKEVVNKVMQKINQTGKLKKGVREILNFMDKKPVKIALASSSYKKVVMTVLKKFDLERYFEVIHSSEEDKYGKPHPEIYLKTLNELEVNPVNAFCFEDSENGLISARAARLKAVAVPAFEERDNKVFSLAEFKLKNLGQFNERIWQSLNNLDKKEVKKKRGFKRIYQVIGVNLAKMGKGLDKFVKNSSKSKK